ncbi:GGDEF domain-containing protein [Massilia sp. IC2-477]|uniref:GGDEF domain-containing protein n=1 Tax=unclassified Massilia TaxID=2609279 RepID=UPI001D105120|nr:MULTISPECIES: GGDEF domain-containing protein [unclassified Massilia]MCC2954428.1 GGDEF domain-containing protein [Massilia sp. IC2-477]MCC2971852.1 GGDEF domain-containing protein [Massilia sp. IC2-476]
MDPIGTFGASPYAVRDLQLFRDADDPAVTAALAPCTVLRVAAGQRVEDGLRARLYIVLSGTLEVAPDAHSGNEDTGVTHVLPGESVGEQAVLDDAVNLAAMTALEDCELLVIEPELVWQLIDRSNVLARNLLRLLSFRVRAANAQLRRRQKLGEFYRQLSLNDGLTGLYNRAWLNEMLPKLAARAGQDGSPLSVIMIDLDHFKRFNDTHGHIAGDAALSAAANIIRESLRPSDFAVRYGGEELMAVLPDTQTGLAEMVAQRLAERLRTAIVFPDMRLPLPHITGSFGVASLPLGGTEHELVAAADAALYRAKQAGRDRVSI